MLLLHRYVNEVAPILASTEKRIVRNYLLWRAAKTSMTSLCEEARDIAHQYNKKTKGVKEQKPLWKQCLEEVGFQSRGGGFHIISASMYVRTFFKAEAKTKMKEMTGLLRVAMTEKLEEAEWMDEETRKAAKLKLDNMLEGIAYPDEMLDQDKLNELFADLETEPGKFYQNGLNTNVFWSDFHNAQFRETAVRDDWLDNGIFNKVILVNAFYSSNANAFVFPAGFLR